MTSNGILRIAATAIILAMLVSLSYGGKQKSAPDSVSIITELRAQKVALTGEKIHWSVVAAGGTKSNSLNYEHFGTLGQVAVDEASSTNYSIRHGFWQDFGTSASCIPGDADGSGGVDIDDVVYEIAYIFSGGPPPVVAVCCGDADGSGGLDIDDVVYLITYIFGGGPAPVDAC